MSDNSFTYQDYLQDTAEMKVVARPDGTPEMSPGVKSGIINNLGRMAILALSEPLGLLSLKEGPLCVGDGAQSDPVSAIEFGYPNGQIKFIVISRKLAITAAELHRMLSQLMRLIFFSQRLERVKFSGKAPRLQDKFQLEVDDAAKILGDELEISTSFAAFYQNNQILLEELCRFVGPEGEQVEAIVLPKKSFDNLLEEERYLREHSIVNYVNSLVNDGHWSMGQLPGLAVMVYALSQFIDQVDNGGFGQYFFNTQGANLLEELRIGLTELELPQYSDLLEQAIALETEGANFRNGDYDELNAAYYEQQSQRSIRDALYDYLESKREFFQLVNDEEYEAFILAMTLEHPNFEFRYQAVIANIERDKALNEQFAYIEEMAAGFCQTNSLEYVGVCDFIDTQIGEQQERVYIFQVQQQAEAPAEHPEFFGIYVSASGSTVFVDAQNFQELCRVD